MLGTLDWAIIALYFLILLGIVWWTSRRNESTDDYFLAGRNVGWFAIGASLFASNIGSEHIVGLAGAGASTGMAMAHWELHAWVIIMLGWIFVPFYYTSGVSTMPEFLERRFGSTTRWILSLVSLAAYVLTKVSVTVYAGAIVFKTLLPETFGTPENAFWVGAFATVILTGIYTVFGGLRAVLYTDSAQAIVLLIGSAMITWIGLDKLGGWSELQSFASNDVAKYALWRPLNDPQFPWLGILMASPIIGIWYWCTDQYIVQRTLAAKNLQTARRGTIWGGFLKIWPVMIFLVPGLIGAALHHKGVIQIPVNADGEIVGDQVFATMVVEMLPLGLRGLVIGGMLAALMSSLSSLFNSSASLFTLDVYKKVRPLATEKQLVFVGRMATLTIVGLGMLWIPIMARLAGNEGVYKYLQSVQGYLAPPITAVFLLGLFHARTNSAGAIAGLVIGFILGMGKLTIETFYGAGSGKLSEPVALAFIGDINFTYMSGILFAIVAALVLAVSHATSPPDDEQIRGLTYASMDRAEVRRSWNSFDLIATLIVLGLTFGVYAYFSFWI
jgi:SSS family solute:Na+ symporter